MAELSTGSVAMNDERVEGNEEASCSADDLNGNGLASSPKNLFLSHSEEEFTSTSQNPLKLDCNSSEDPFCDGFLEEAKNGVDRFEAINCLPSAGDDEEESWWPSPPNFCDSESSSVGEVLQTVCSTALENFDVILQRTARERSSELSELQNTARPVTGTDARQNLSQFFLEAVDPVTQPQQRPLPEDVQNLIRRSIVTSALRRHGFRSALEQSLASRLTPTVFSANSILQGNQQSTRSASGTSTPSLFNQDTETASIFSDTTTEQNDFSDAASEIEQLQRVLDAGVQVLSETIEEDLAQLHHLHVVSSVLDGDFRNNLESLFQERARNVGGGEIVEQFIRSLPTTNRQHQPTANQPNATQRNSSARSLTRSQQLNVSAEINSLKQQMDEMKRMLQMTFEMQMDTQRAIRQEVSAVFGAFMQHMSQAPNEAHLHQSRDVERHVAPINAGACVICLDKEVDTVLYHCGHMCVCNACGMHLKIEGQRCPMCRAPIRDVIRAYKAQ